ncbi:MAG: helix-turn-helix domain-containing protein, partial [Desulfofustis sp.]
MKEQRIIELFVSEEESSMLEKIAEGEAPFSQRAQAILAVDAGSNLEQAAAVAGLRVTQVRYWIGRFNNSRLNIFPETIVDRFGEQQDSESRVELIEIKKEKTKESKKKP